MKLDSNTTQAIRELIASRVKGYSLQGAFYCDESIYSADLRCVWQHGWIFVGFTCQVPVIGDYFTIEIGDDSLVIVRTDEQTLTAFHNVCRHRGSLICDRQNGNTRRFVCPYHQWSYELDGSLASSHGMGHEVPENVSLAKVHVRVLSGMVFVCLADEAPDFDRAKKLVEPLASPQGIETAKVAQAIDYEVCANWKLVWENNRECYHCNANHPQYIKANFDIYDASDLNEKSRLQLESQLAQYAALQQDQGPNTSVSHPTGGIASFPDPELNQWYSANRTVLAPGFVSESMDGKQVAPLMGSYQHANVGTLRMRTVPNMWCHASADHVVATRLLPAGVGKTQIRVMWLVNEEAVEGEHYDLASLLPFWQLTSEQDWELCERAQKGVRSSQYEPGPYSATKEYNVEAFVRWYLNQLVQFL